MIMKKIILIGLFGLFFTYTYAQTGIHFDSTHVWSAIIEKAQKEHKFIFVDCYATWCGPCKTMDKEIYPLKEVGDVYNKNSYLLSCKWIVPHGDNKEIKDHYKLVKEFAYDYGINAFPTLLFFDSLGVPLHKVVGSLTKKEFISLAGDAKNPQKQYYTLLKDYQPGKLDQSELVSLINKFEHVDKELSGKMAADLLNRITDSLLSRHLDMLFHFANNPELAQKAVGFIARLSKNDFANPDILAFIAKFQKVPAVQGIVLNYLQQLNKKEINKKEILFLTVNFFDTPQIHQWFIDYLNSLPTNELKLNLAWFRQFKNDPALIKSGLIT
jgi:thioredoxin-related protein